MTEAQSYATGYQDGARRVADYFLEMIARAPHLEEGDWQLARDIIVADCERRHPTTTQGETDAG